ncbi:hypothetical protein E2320_009392, partial [Naja naja]
SDPLGLNAAPAPADGGAAEVATVESRLWKRKLSEEGQPSGNLAKKPKVGSPLLSGPGRGLGRAEPGGVEGWGKQGEKIWLQKSPEEEEEEEQENPPGGGAGKPRSSASPEHFQHSRDATVEGVGCLSRREAGRSLATNRVSQASGCVSRPVSGQEETKLVISIKRTVYWDLDIQTNAVIKQRAPSEVLSPHPEVELLRSQLMLKLRQHYRELCQQREGNGSPSP